MNVPELPDAESASLPFVSVEARRATLSLLEAVGAFESGARGEWNFVNHHLCDMLNVPASSLLGREWIKMIHPDDVQRAVAEYKQARDGGRAWHQELRFKCYDGTELPVLIEANPLPQDPDAKGVSYLGVVSDMSTQRRVESVANEARTALGAMLDAVDEGIIVHRDGWIILANDFAARILGYEKGSDLVGLHGSALVASEDHAKLHAAATSGVETENVATYLRRDGTPIRLSVRGKTMVFAGAPARAVVLLPLESPLLLRLSNERLQAQLDAFDRDLMLPSNRLAMRDGVAVYVSANQAYADLVGRPISQLIGLPLDEVVPRELNADVWAAYEEKLTSGSRPAAFDVTYRWPDGTLTRGRVYAVDSLDPVSGDMLSLSFVVPL